MSKLEKQKEKAKGLEAKDPKGAIGAWLDVLRIEDEEASPNPDLSIFNRIGDLYLKIKDPGQAADYYDRAVDKYAELGFHNNAIAMCNKVLRNAPARQTTYLKLATLYAAKGFMAEAKQHLIAYAERMQKAGKIEQAFAALKEFTDISPESAHLREMLEEHLRMYGTPERRSTGTAAAAAPVSRPKDDVTKSGSRKSSSLVFLDVDAPAVPRAKPGARATPPPRPAPPPEPVLEPEADPTAESLIEPVGAEPDSSLDIETTSLGEGLEHGGASGMLEGFETTSADFGDVRLDVGEVSSLRQEVTADDVPPMADLEPTVPTEADRTAPETDLEPLMDHELEIAPPGPPRPPGATKPPAAVPGRPGPRVSVPKVMPPVRSTPRVVTPGSSARSATPAAPGAPARGPVPKPLPKFEPPKAAPPKVQPVVPRRPAAEPPKRKTAVEVPPLELEPDFETAEAESGRDLDDAPLVVDESGLVGAPPEGRRSGFIDLGLEAGARAGDETGSLVFSHIEGTPAKTTIKDLEARVADDPDDPEGHQALGEALIEEGERERGIEELDHATTGFENRGNLSQAQDLVSELLRLDPNSVRHRQKQVEFAFKSGDKAKLIDAYLELADTLLRSDLPDKARAVYQRVAEHDPQSERAKAALAMLAPVASPPPPPPAKAPAKGRDADRKTAPKDAKVKVRGEAATEEGEWIDLGAMILEEEMPERNPRMTVADEEPTGDEERDFQDMLTRFKQGIDENIDEADFQSHYDLGVAFKEMGLLDEAIAELQKALRAPEGKLKSSEALGVCFVQKGAHVVAESILRRALELPATGDQDRLGILYWLGRALEAQGKRGEAREVYGRVFAVDVRFMDVGERAKALARVK